MPVDKSSPTFLEAMRDFRRARQQAVLEDILARLTGKSDDLLDYDEVFDRLKGGQPVPRGLEEIPLAAIVGSVGRYVDFTRSFLPRSKSDLERWAEVKAAIIERGRIPPITVYRIDQAYFVLDGNHRVSVARQRGDIHIPAYVTEIQTDVPFSPDVQPDELIIKARYADFLSHFPIHQIRPEVDLSVTAPGSYRTLEEQIDIYRDRLREQTGREITPEEAVEGWYDQRYWPVVEIVRQRGLLRHFPDRTETDLYVWLVRHQEELKAELGWEVDPQAAAAELVTQFSFKPVHILARFKEKLLDVLTPDPFEAGPPPGHWRKNRLPLPDSEERLFHDILVPVSGSMERWTGVDQAALVAKREQSRLHGLHVVAADSEKASRHSQAMRAQFEHRCRQAGVPGELTFETGKVLRTICSRARWTDLVVIHFTQLPQPRPGDRFTFSLGTLIRRSSRPILAVPTRVSPLNRALLAFDGSPKAKEALFVATYLAGKWQIPLVVVTVLEEGRTDSETLTYARDYLAAHHVEATFVQERGPVAWVIIRTARLYESDFIIMGGYGFNPVVEVMLGSEVDQILRAEQWPVLICR